MSNKIILKDIAEIREQLQNNCMLKSTDTFEENAVKFINNELNKIAIQIAHNVFSHDENRNLVITRIVEEINPQVIPVEIGRRLIAIERFYHNLQ